MTDNDENLILNALCEVLTKYYGSNTPNTPSIPQPQNDGAVATTTDKEKLKKAIAGLEILAEKGNEKAKKAIIGLKYILNK